MPSRFFSSPFPSRFSRHPLGVCAFPQFLHTQLWRSRWPSCVALASQGVAKKTWTLNIHNMGLCGNGVLSQNSWSTYIDMSLYIHIYICIIYIFIHLEIHFIGMNEFDTFFDAQFPFFGLTLLIMIIILPIFLAIQIPTFCGYTVSSSIFYTLYTVFAG